jgi:hypothetical protein
MVQKTLGLKIRITAKSPDTDTYGLTSMDSKNFFYDSEPLHEQVKQIIFFYYYAKNKKNEANGERFVGFYMRKRKTLNT